MRHAAITFFALLLACDVSEPTPSPRGGGWTTPEPPIRPSRRDCRSAHYCYRDCLGAGFLVGELAVDGHEGCVEACEPEVLAGGPAQTELDHWAWWIDAVEVQCADDWTDACIWNAAIPDLHGDGGDLSGTTLDACLRPRW